MNWNPWDEYKQDPEEILPISSPPCPSCRNWKPKRRFLQTKEGLVYDGVSLCHSQDMLHDFSCFRSEEGDLTKENGDRENVEILSGQPEYGLLDEEDARLLCKKCKKLHNPKTPCAAVALMESLTEPYPKKPGKLSLKTKA